MGLKWDDSAFPVVRIEFDGQGDPLPELRGRMESLFASSRPFATITFAPHLMFTDSDVEVHARWLERMGPEYRRLCRAMAYVIDDPATRLRFRSIAVGVTIPVSYELFESVAIAEAWVREQLAG